VKRNFGGVEHFIKGVREILGAGVYPPPPSKSAHDILKLNIAFSSQEGKKQKYFSELMKSDNYT
jgi:hypothetical protein